MKFSIKPNLLKLMVLAAGLLGMMLRVVLYTACTDEKGLLVRGHWCFAALWILTAIVLIGLFLCTWGITGPKRYRFCYPQTQTAPLSYLAVATSLAVTAIGDLLDPMGAMPAAVSFLAIAAGLCLAAVGFCRLTGRKAPFLLHVVVCLALALRMVCLYRNWSSDPQLLNYCFYMGAYITLTLTAYEHAAFSCGMGNHRKLWLCSLAAAYLCLVAVWNSPSPVLLLTAAFWCTADLTSLKIPRRRPRPRIQAEGEGL